MRNWPYIFNTPYGPIEQFAELIGLLRRRNPREITDQEYIELYNYLYPFQGDPLLWVHLNTDYPYNLQGILYFPRIGGRADWEKGEIKLYWIRSKNRIF